MLYSTPFSRNFYERTTSYGIPSGQYYITGLRKNKFDILKLANEKGLGKVRWIEETVSGKVSWRKRKIAPIIEKAQAQDVLIVSELSRIGRNMLECMELSIAIQKKLRIYAVKGN